MSKSSNQSTNQPAKQKTPDTSGTITILGEQAAPSLEFIVPGRAVPKGSWKQQRGRLVPDNKKSKPFEKSVAIRARLAATTLPVGRDIGVSVHAFCFFNRPPSHFKSKGRELAANARPFPTYQNLGDSDKIARAILDGLNGVLYEDDSQVIDVRVQKHWTTDTERTIVRVKFVEGW